ncbi:efflux RND transporter permease subunit [Vibrio cyclitrophicus]|uniref:efflux RND transporter permease subunit n=1 Tax=Vibrio cyclitrophicus TaxID=47951 RepID=UPI001112FB8C
MNNARTVTVYGLVNTLVANTEEVVADALVKTLPNLQQTYPSLKVTVKGEVDNSAITKNSLRKGLVLGLLSVFVLLSFQFRSYSEPLLIMTAIPLALIGVIFGHVVM